MSPEQPAWTRELLTSPHDVPDKADRVRRMFNAIAPRYELINTLFSLGRDAAWRRIAVRLADVTPLDDVLDVACGTGDLARAFARANPRIVVGCDFAHDMLRRACTHRKHFPADIVNTRRSRPPGGAPIFWCEADALRLPFGEGSFSITSCGFGVRNLADLDTGLSEMYRVLRSGGRAVILEFSRPANRFVRHMHNWYAGRVMPPAAAWISGDRFGAYRYLPKSVVSFPDGAQMRERLTRAGFSRVSTRSLTMGIVTIYVAFRD